MNGWSKASLIALRVAVGWHFLYEGLWKIDSDTGARSYAISWYALQSSVARLRDDPARADAWWDGVVKTFKARNRPLSEEQKARLGELRDKVQLAAFAGEPSDFDWTMVRDEVLQLAAEQEGERFTSLRYLRESAGPFRPFFRALVWDIDGVERLTGEQARAAIDRRYEERHYRFTTEQQRRLAEARDAAKTAIAVMLQEAGFRARGSRTTD